MFVSLANFLDRLAKAESERLLKKEASSKKTTTVVVSAAPAKRTDGHTGSSSITQKVHFFEMKKS